MPIIKTAGSIQESSANGIKMTVILMLTYINATDNTFINLTPTLYGRIKMNDDATTMKHLAVVIGCLVALCFGLMLAVTLIT